MAKPSSLNDEDFQIIDKDFLKNISLDITLWLWGGVWFATHIYSLLKSRYLPCVWAFPTDRGSENRQSELQKEAAKITSGEDALHLFLVV